SVIRPVKSRLIEAYNDYHIASERFQPTMIGQHSVCVIRVVHIYGFATQGWVPETKMHELLQETVKILHPLVPSLWIKPFEENKVISRSARIIGPLFVFQKFLSHKEHRNAGCC